MAKHIGIVACSAEGAALCYRTICAESPAFMGQYNHPEISMHTHPLGEYMQHISAGNWEGVADMMLSSADKLVRIGADFLICPDNTIHQALPLIMEQSPLPWLHIARVVADEAKKNGFTRLGITGTKYIMTGPVYPDILKVEGISYELPEPGDQELIDDIIFSQLVNGTFLEESRLYFNEVIQKFKDKGCQAVVLGCTEIPLLVIPDDTALPTLDSTRLLARAAIQEAMKV
jgi:aspartate racemase